MVLSEYWKTLEENFQKRLFPRFSKEWWNLQKKSSSLFQYCEKTIASTETNDTSAESSDIQLFAAGKFEGLALSGGHLAPFPQKHILLNFMATQRVFDFLSSMTSLGGYFKDTIFFRMSYESWIVGLSSEISFVSVQTLVPSKFWTQRFSGIDFYTLYKS